MRNSAITTKTNQPLNYAFTPYFYSEFREFRPQAGPSNIGTVTID